MKLVRKPNGKLGRPPGRPTLLDPSLTKRFCDYLRAGATESGAAAACGWEYITYQGWIRRGLGLDPERPPSEEFASFARAVIEARGSARVLTEAQVRKQHPLPWLYNRYPDDWKPPAQNVRLVGGRSSGLDDDTAEDYLAQMSTNGNGNHNGNGRA